MKRESGMIQQDLKILPKLLKISTFFIWINVSPQNLRLAKMRKKEVDNQELSFIICLKNYASK